MNETTMPLEAYIFVGITALLLSYVTIMESPSTPIEEQSATSMLPASIFSPASEVAPSDSYSSFMSPATEVAPSASSIIPSFMSPATEVAPASAPSSMLPSFMTPATAVVEPESTGFSENPQQPASTLRTGGGKRKRTRKSKKTNKKTKSNR